MKKKRDYTNSAPALAFDCSNRTLAVAIVAAGKVCAEAPPRVGENHSVTLLPMIEHLCGECGVTIADMEYIAFTTGPGAFTALRIAAAAAKGFALARQVPLVGVPTLEALALNVLTEAYEQTALICPLLDARKGLVYTAAFEALGRVLPLPPVERYIEAQAAGKGGTDDEAFPACELASVFPQRLCSPGEFLADISNTATLAKKRVIFLGSGALLHREMIVATLGEQAVFGLAPTAAVWAGRLGLYAARLFADGRHLTPLSFTPLYLQVSSAEK